MFSASMTGRSARLRGRISGALALALLLAGDVLAQVSAVCAPERAVVAVGESVRVRTWLTDGAGLRLQTPVSFAWRTSSGTIWGGDAARWTVSAGPLAKPAGPPESFEAKATLVVDAQPRGRATCEVTVFVEASQPTKEPDILRSTRVAARAFLLPQTTEPAEYGLRSYLIFTTPPRGDADRERYARALEAYLQVLIPAEDLLGRNVRASRLSVTMLPVLKAPGSLRGFDTDPGAASLARDLLETYDYARARALMAELDAGEVGGGPYLIAREATPHGDAAGTLLVDMTGVSSSLIWDWMTWFCWLTGQERSWGEVALRRLGLNMRNIIAVTAETMPVVLTSAGPSMHVLKRR